MKNTLEQFLTIEDKGYRKEKQAKNDSRVRREIYNLRLM